jgi:hypothetical protein
MHAARMFARVRSHFKDAHLARMSDGTFCVIRDLGLVKGGKGMRHHEVLLTLSLKALSRLIQARTLSWLRSLAPRAEPPGQRQTSASESPNELSATKF